MVFGGRASFLPTTVDRTAAILHQGLLEVHPQLAGYRIDYAWGGNVGFTFDRMPHVGRTKDGVTYAMGCCGTGVALMTAPRDRGRGVARRRRGAGARAAEVPARAGAVRGPAVVPAVRRRVVPAPGSAGSPGVGQAPLSANVRPRSASPPPAPPLTIRFDPG